MQEGSHLSTLAPEFIVCGFLMEAIHQYEVISHFSFDLHFVTLTSFQVPIGLLYIFFGEMSIYIFHTFLDWIACLLDMELHELFVYCGE